MTTRHIFYVPFILTNSGNVSSQLPKKSQNCWEIYWWKIFIFIISYLWHTLTKNTFNDFPSILANGTHNNLWKFHVKTHVSVATTAKQFYSETYCETRMRSVKYHRRRMSQNIIIVLNRYQHSILWLLEETNFPSDPWQSWKIFFDPNLWYIWSK